MQIQMTGGLRPLYTSRPFRPSDRVEIGRSQAPLGLMPRPQTHGPIGGYPNAHLDRSVSPAQDFYRFSVGGFEKANPIPADKSAYGFRTELHERISKELLEICERAATQPGNELERKFGDLYASAMDEAAIEATGLSNLQPFWQRLEAIDSKQGVMEAVGWLHARGVGGMFGFGAAQDRTDPDRTIASLGQGGLTLPNRDDYQKPELREKYTAHLARMFALAEEPQPQARAEAVLRVETRMAQGFMSKVELRDPHKTYNPTDLAGLQKRCPQIDWTAYLASQRLGDPGKINLSTPDALTHMGKLLEEIPVEDWKTYLKWHSLNSLGSLLPDRFGAEQFEFTGRTLNGIPERAPRPKRALRFVESVMGEALGQEFVKKNFPPEAKARALAMIDNIKAALREKIQNGWMSPETKKEALTKVDTMNVKIGYPDQWDDYATLTIRRDSLFDNVMGARAQGRREDLDSIGKPTDRSRWSMTPQTVNAYYSPLNNEICFPAARLQPPFFDLKMDDAYNYGATGATIGHEICHGFDDKGSKYDAQGRMRNWWTEADRARFDGIANGIVAQMNEFSFEGQPNNGKLVAGEAIADQGGLDLGYAALQKSLADKPAPASLDGFTPEQRFFLAYALCRQGATRPEAAHQQMSNDPHPLAPFRVNGPLANMPEFHAAFGVKPGDPLCRPEQLRHRLWP